jgi:spermidine/putrescine transport system ATP-binding protein
MKKTNTENNPTIDGNGGTTNRTSWEGEHDVVLSGITHYFGSNRVLDNVSLSIRKGEFFGILGPSGSGKTTTMRIIGGFIIPAAGDVYLQNELMGRKPAYSRNTTMVFQHLALFPHMNVFNNLAYGLKIRRVARDEIQARVKKVLGVVHLEGFEDRYPKKLSGGQQQRVALARALIVEPSVVLFDEPLGSLDLKLRREMQIEIKNIQRRLGTTFIYVTHDQQEALNMCDRIAILNEGRIEQIGTAEEIYERPRTRFVADFIGDINFLDGMIVALDGNTVTVDSHGISLKAEARGELQTGNSVALCIRPERIMIGKNAESCHTSHPARIMNMIYSGAVRRCIVRLPNDALIKVDLDAKSTAGVSVGDETKVGWYRGDEVLLAEGTAV